MYINLPLQRSLVATASYWIRMTASLLTLPGEILNLIVLPSEDLSALSRVCKPLRQLMLPRLYGTIHLTWTMELTGNTKIHFFVRSLLENRCLSALVKHFCCIGETNMEVRYAKQWPGTFWEEGITKTLEDDKLIMKAKEVLYSAEFPEPLSWIDALEMGNVDVFVALILLQLPQLQTLHLDADFITDNEFIGLLFKHVLSSNNQSPARRCLSTFADLIMSESFPRCPSRNYRVWRPSMQLKSSPSSIFPRLRPLTCSFWITGTYFLGPKITRRAPPTFGPWTFRIVKSTRRAWKGSWRWLQSWKGWATTGWEIYILLEVFELNTLISLY